PSRPLMNGLRLGDSAGPSLLLHTVEVVDRADASSKRMPLGNRGGHVGLRQQHSLGKASIEGQVAGHRGREGAPGAVGGVGALAFGLKDFLFHYTFGLEAEEIDGLLEIAAGDNDGFGAHLVELNRSRAHLVEIRNRESSKGSR